MGIAQRQCGEEEFRQTLLEASAIAKELGDGDRLATAAIENNRGSYTTSEFGQREVVEALESALELVGEEQLTRRAMLNALLALELIFSAEVERRIQLADKAEGLARESGDERTLAFVLTRSFTAVMIPETLESRSQNLEEVAKLVKRVGDRAMLAQSAIFNASVAIELGDRDRLDLNMAQLSELAGERAEPFSIWASASLCALEALLNGGTEEAERLAGEAAQIGSDNGQATPSQILLPCSR